MSKTGMVIWTIAGSVVGLLVGGGAVAGPILGLCYRRIIEAHYWEPLLFIIFGVPGIVIGATIGAAGGAAIMRKVLRQKSSFWKALGGTIRGLLYGFFLAVLIGIFLGGISKVVMFGLIICTSIVTGAVIGSGSNDQPADFPSSGSWPHSSAFCFW
jgi:hypothetical protein